MKKREEKFIDLYMKRYSKEGETSLECSERIITRGIKADEEKEYKRFYDMVTSILPKKTNKKLREKIIKGLRLNYGPRCV